MSGLHIPTGRRVSIVLGLVLAVAMQIVPLAYGANWFPIGYANYDAVGASSIRLSNTPDSGVALPALARHAIFTFDQATCILYVDSVSATPTTAACYAAGQSVTFVEERAVLERVQFVAEDASAPPRVHIDYFSN